MKRFLLLLVLFAVAALCASAAAEDGNVIEIRTVDDLKAVTAHPGARFRLMNDLDLRGEDWLPIPFSGELDGGNFGIYNLSVTRVGEEVRTTTDANWKEYENVFAGLFSTVEDSTIRDLKVIGAHVAIEGKTHTFAAILAGFAKYSNFDNVTVAGRVRLENEAVMAGVGGVAGFGSGRFTNCSARVDLVVNDLNRESRCEEVLGAIRADESSTITRFPAGFISLSTIRTAGPTARPPSAKSAPALPKASPMTPRAGPSWRPGITSRSWSPKPAKTRSMRMK